MSKVSKQSLGLAGEYAVASELCRRGCYAQLTLGHHKSADILIETEKRMVRVQVKAKQGTQWPGVHGISRSTDFLVLVDYQSKEVGEIPDFYVLGMRQWKRILQMERIRKPGVVITRTYRVVYPDGWKGVNLRVKDVMRAKEAWNRITG
ncbi:MAG: hypothetical protein KAY24_01270 [Candidatus Eisenbacteria sp.]|nr:hypothetical protein [Candidatus Eisenbacteria bacterium]